MDRPHPTITIAGSTRKYPGSGQGGQEGIYKRIRSTLYRVADKSTPIPGGSGSFFEFNFGVTSSGENVAFAAGGDNGQEGIYKEVDGNLFKVADTDTQIPGGTGSFADFYNDTPSIDGKWVVFNGRDSAGLLGVYTDYSGSLQKIVDENDLLDDKPFYGVTTSRESFDCDLIVITVAFEDSSRALYLVRPESGRKGDVTVPAFGDLGLLFLVLIIAGAGLVLVGKRERIG